ncbi:MAG: SMC-Scp complex subunit ScpB [Candidatus Omnitrophica bacterium]|nr:SMC-Scp complex subunit ScpB [Candidatus Omnitrophota bacterium]
MFEGNLKQVVEALLFVSDKPLTVKQVVDVCEGVEPAAVKEAVQALIEKYNTPDQGIQIAEVAGGYQFTTHPDCVDYLKKLYTTRRVFRLSAPSLETLAIVAYKQPVTRAEIEFIRGVNVDGVIKTLEERDLIKIKGKKDVPGKPILYGTTEEFLHYFGLKSLQELPTIEEFTAKAMENAAEMESMESFPNPAEQLSEPQSGDPAVESKETAAEESAGAFVPDEPPQVTGKGDDYERDEHSEIAQSN